MPGGAKDTGDTVGTGEAKDTGGTGNTGGAEDTGNTGDTGISDQDTHEAACAESLDDDSLEQRDYWLPPVVHGQCGDWEDVCRSTGANAIDAISFVQVMESALIDIHDMLNHIYALTLQKANGTCTEADIAEMNQEIEQLIWEIDYCQNYTMFDGFHFLAFAGQTFHAPIGCPYSCHHDWTITSMEPVQGLSTNSTPDDVDAAIAGVSIYRSMLGSNQNALEHVRSTCENLCENGFGSGIEYAETASGEHHLLMADMTGTQSFWAEWAAMANRVRELTEQKENDPGYTEADRECFDTEIAALDTAKDFLIDLLCEGTGAKHVVPAPSAPEPSLIYAVVYNDGVDGAAFGAEVHGCLAEGDATPAFAGSTVHDGYFLAGWDRTVKETVEAGDANDAYEIVYTARWEAAGGELPKTGGAGTGVYLIAGIACIAMAGGAALVICIKKRKK